MPLTLKPRTKAKKFKVIYSRKKNVIVTKPYTEIPPEGDIEMHCTREELDMLSEFADEWQDVIIELST